MSHDETWTETYASSGPFDVFAPANAVVAGRYALGGLLGRGGFGQVHRATDLRTDREVALKQVRVSTDRARTLIRREVAALRHARLPGIVHLLDDGPTPEGWYLVMDLVSGTYFPGGPIPMPWTRLQPLVLRLIEVLLPLHCAGLVHRDLKPANVLVDPHTGALTVVDLGLARGPALRTRPEEAKREGTPGYSAPEQLAGFEGDSRADLYAVGIMVVEALTGTRPPRHTARQPRLLPEALHAQAGLSAEAAVALLALLDPDPERRPTSAIDLLSALGGAPPGPLAGGRILSQTIGRIPESGLRGLFASPSRFLHIEEDGARLLFTRTGGWPTRVDQEVGAWLRMGFCHWVDGKIVLDRASIERLTTLGGPLAPPAGPDPTLGALQAEVLAAARVSGAGTRLSVVAQVSGRSLAEVEGAVDALELLGLAWRMDRDRVGASAGAPIPLAQLSRLARRLPAGHPGRIQAALREGSPKAALEEIEVALESPDEEAMRGGLLRLALDLARELEEPACIAFWLSEVSAWCAADRSPAGLEEALWEVARTEPRDHEIEQIERLLRVIQAQRHGRPVPEPIGLLPEFQHEGLERLRRGERVREARLRGTEAMAAEVEGMADWARSGPPDRLGQWLGWLGLVRYRQNRPSQAAELHLEAMELRTSPVGRLTAMINAAAATLESGEPGAAEQIARGALALAERRRDLAREVDLVWILRAAAYKLERPLPADPSLVRDARTAGHAAGLLALQEAALAWRGGDHRQARLLAAEAEELTRASDSDTWALSCAFRRGLGDATCGPDDLAQRCRAIASPAVRAQALTWLAVAQKSEVLADEARAAALEAPQPPGRRQEILSMREAGDLSLL